MKIIQNTLKLEKKCLKKNRIGPKKVGSVGFPETRLFFLAEPLCNTIILVQANFRISRAVLSVDCIIFKGNQGLMTIGAQDNVVMNHVIKTFNCILYV